MKQMLFAQLAPTPEQHVALMQTLEALNAACNTMAVMACRERCANGLALQKLVYYDIRKQFGVSSQMTIRAISRVSDAYKAHKRGRQAVPRFRPHGAMVYDERICSFPLIDCVSLLTLSGRVDEPFRFGAHARDMLNIRVGKHTYCIAMGCSFWQ